jgi:hypothetical protein
MSNNELQLIALAMIALGFILAIAVAIHVINRQPRHARVTNTPEEAQRILNKFFSGYTEDNDSLDSMPVNALSSDESLPLREFIVLSGDSVIVKARSAEEAEQIYYAELNDDDCPCGLPQWGFEADAEGKELCKCIENNETLTWVREA